MKTDAIIVKPSQIDRQGIFATRDFKKGESVTHWDTTHTISEEEYHALEDTVKEHTSTIGDGTYIIIQEPERFMNHSCEPNTYVKGPSDIALRDIKKGEEITSDYSSDSGTDSFFICTCGSKNCKTTIYY